MLKYFVFLNRKRLLVLFVSLFFSLLLIELLFFYLEKANNERYFTSIKSILSNETSLGNSYLVARSLSNMVEMGFIECVELHEVFPQKRIFLDLSYHDYCLGKQDSRNFVSGEIEGARGNIWNISFSAKPSEFFILSLWLGRIMIFSLVFLILVWFWKVFDREEKLRIFEGYQKEKIKLLASQVTHDVASPLSALNLVSQHPSLSAEVKDLLFLSAQRMQSILQDLNKKIREVDSFSKKDDSSSNDIVETVGDIVREKKIIYQEIIWKPTIAKALCRGSKVEIGRVISNILDNAIEASDTGRSEVEISLIKNSDRVVIEISDSGVGIPAEILDKIGLQGFTFGKKNGSGIGYFHAKSYLESIGGSINLSSRVGRGTQVTIFIPI